MSTKTLKFQAIGGSLWNNFDNKYSAFLNYHQVVLCFLNFYFNNTLKSNYQVSFLWHSFFSLYEYFVHQYFNITPVLQKFLTTHYFLRQQNTALLAQQKHFCKTDFSAKVYTKRQKVHEKGNRTNPEVFKSCRKHACLVCGRSFAQKANRNRHMCLHTGLKPFMCVLCGVKFSRGDKLKLHVKKFHHDNRV